MTMPTIEDLVEVFRVADLSPQRQGYRTGLLAVLDALKLMVAEAYEDGEADMGQHAYGAGKRTLDGSDYAAKIIAQLKGESRE